MERPLKGFGGGRQDWASFEGLGQGRGPSQAPFEGGQRGKIELNVVSTAVSYIHFSKII